MRLRNYRGVIDSTVELATGGVTVIEGDNEVGKTCIPEAIDLILKYPDSSKAGPVKDVRPVHRAVSPEVEIEASSGDYRFVYSKRWHLKPQTTLHVSSPSARQLTGREAHDWVEAMLEETLDADLWRALRVEQGSGMALPSFDVPSLGRALDKAAGGDSAGGGEDDLWERICTERERYWTPKGQISKERRSSARRVEKARAEVEALEARLAEIENDVAEVDRRVVDEARLVEVRERAAREERKRGEHRDGIEKLRSAVDARRSSHRASVAERDSIAADVERRTGLVKALEDRTAELSTLQTEAEKAAPALAAAIGHKEESDVALVSADSALRDAKAVQSRAAGDRDHHRDRIDLDLLTERYDRVVAAQQQLIAAEAILESAKVDDELVARIEEAHLAVVAAEAAAAGSAVEVEATALSPITLRIDGEDTALAAGAAASAAVTDEFSVIVPEIVEVRVRAAAGSRDLAAGLVAARREFTDRCAQAGVANQMEAREAAERRREAEKSRDEAHKIIAQDLRDLTPESLRRMTERLSGRIASYAVERPPSPPLPANLKEATRIVSEADEDVAVRERERTRRDTDAGKAAENHQKAELDNANLSGRIDNACSAAAAAARLLDTARGQRSDSDLQGALALAQQEVDAASGLLERAEGELRAADPGSLEELLRNATEAVERADSELEANRGCLRELRVGLELRGEEGLAADLDEARRTYEHLEREHERTEARAHAAGLLHDTFENRRRESLKRYAAPFKESIERFGRIVFGPGFEVELDDDLRVVRRTLGGVTLDVDLLSVGAREQLGVLARLACAAIVSPEGGGTPVVLDDALGWSDPTRLVRMGAAIAAAGRECQVIVLTCTPGRYSHVGNATVVTL